MECLTNKKGTGLFLLDLNSANFQYGNHQNLNWIDFLYATITDTDNTVKYVVRITNDFMCDEVFVSIERLTKPVKRLANRK